MDTRWTHSQHLPIAIATLRHLGLLAFYRDFTNWDKPLATFRPWDYPRERIWMQPWRIGHFVWRHFLLH